MLAIAEFACVLYERETRLAESACVGEWVEVLWVTVAHYAVLLVWGVAFLALCALLDVCHIVLLYKFGAQATLASAIVEHKPICTNYALPIIDVPLSAELCDAEFPILA